MIFKHGAEVFRNILFYLQSIYKFVLSVCLSVRLYPINVKTAEPVGPKFFEDLMSLFRIEVRLKLCRQFSVNLFIYFSRIVDEIHEKCRQSCEINTFTTQISSAKIGR